MLQNCEIFQVIADTSSEYLLIQLGANIWTGSFVELFNDVVVTSFYERDNGIWEGAMVDAASSRREDS